MADRNKSYVEHVAFKVKDIGWHIRFFHEVLGMPVKEMDGPRDAPLQGAQLGAGARLVVAADHGASSSSGSSKRGKTRGSNTLISTITPSSMRSTSSATARKRSSPGRRR